ERALDAAEQPGLLEHVARCLDLGLRDVPGAVDDHLHRDRAGEIGVGRGAHHAVARAIRLRRDRRIDLAVGQRPRLARRRHVDLLRRARGVVAAPFERAVRGRECDQVAPRRRLRLVRSYLDLIIAYPARFYTLTLSTAAS